MIKEKLAEKLDITQEDILPEENSMLKVTYSVAAIAAIVISLISVIL